jgi:hypothetical protein
LLHPDVKFEVGKVVEVDRRLTPTMWPLPRRWKLDSEPFEIGGEILECGKRFPVFVILEKGGGTYHAD